MAIVVGELIAVVFVDIELLILDLPARAPDLDHYPHIGRVDVQIGNPTIVIERLPAPVVFPDFHGGHAPLALHRPRHLAHEPIGIEPLPRPAALRPLPGLTLLCPLRRRDCRHEGRMRVRLGHKHIVLAQLVELFDKRDMGVEIIADDDQGHLRMLAPHARDQPLARGQFTILRRTLRRDIAHFFHIQRQDLMRARPYHRRPDDLMRVVDPARGIGLAQTMRTLNLGRAEILTAVQRYRIVRPLVLPTGHDGRKPRPPACPADFLPDLWEHSTDRCGLHPSHNLPHLRVRGDLAHPEDRLQITPLAPFLHRPLKLQETGMLEKHQRKATHQGIVQGIAELLGGPRIFNRAERGGQEINNRC